jgi:hypothetical protein
VANLLTKFFGRTASEGAAFALGLATGPVLAPEVESLKNDTWRLYPSRVVDPDMAAEIVAEDVELSAWGASEAAAHGIDGERFAAIVGAVLNAPGVPELLELRRRGAISQAQLEHGFRKARLESLWDGPLEQLLAVLLSPSELATARQQGFITPERQHSEAALQGIDDERAEIQYEIAGLPPGIVEGLQMLRRGIIDEPTFRQIVREGHTKTKYTDNLLALEQVILSPSTYATLHLKGHITEAEMIAGGALSGESADNMQKLYLSMGRPAAPGQLWTAAARKIDGPEGRPMDEAQFQTAIAQSDIRPEYGSMLWEIRYLYPPLFQLTRLVAANTITPAQAADWATKDRYAPEVVAALLSAWQAGGVSTSKGLTVTDLKTRYEGHGITKTEYVNGLKELGYSAEAADAKVAVSDDAKRYKSLTLLRNRTRTRYTSWRISRQAASDALRGTGLTIALVNEILTDADVEKDLNVHTLTEAQIVKAHKTGLMDTPTATERLTELGLATSDIATRLAI